MSRSGKPHPPPQRLAAGYFLGFAFLAFAVLLWLRGFGRLLLPVLVLVVVGVVVARIVRAIKAPLP